MWLRLRTVTHGYSGEGKIGCDEVDLTRRDAWNGTGCGGRLGACDACELCYRLVRELMRHHLIPRLRATRLSCADK